MPTLEIRVIGSPAPQGSKRHVGKGIMIESSKKVVPWRQDVVSAARFALLVAGMDGPLNGPILMRAYFTVPKPKSAPKKKIFPDKYPDLSKLVRSTEDALTTAGVWEDDSRVVICIARKVFPNEHAYSLNVPGAVLFISNDDALIADD